MKKTVHVVFILVLLFATGFGIFRYRTNVKQELRIGFSAQSAGCVYSYKEYVRLEPYRNDIERIATDDYTAVFFSMYPIDHFTEYDFNHYREIYPLKASYCIPDLKTMYDYFNRVSETYNETEIAYLGIRPDIINAEDLIDLMGIPDDYEVLFVQGGASQQFAAVPMNLMKNRVADYIVTGQWAKKALAEGKIYGQANKIASSEDKTFTYIPDVSDLPVTDNADYVYICQNNTIYGTKYKELPNTKGKLLVSDQSSMFLSEPCDVSRFGLIFAGAQKNIGPAGNVIVIIRKDLITEDVLPGTPTMLKYKTQADNDSLYNTPNAYGIYICGKVFRWIKNMGGLEVMKERNEKKAKLLYDFLDQSRMFVGTVEKDYRSLMNVPFVTGSDELNAKFIDEAKHNGLVQLKGHRTVGGMRASIYNAMPYEGVVKLVEFMDAFEKNNK